MAAIIENHPTALVGAISFFRTMAIAPRKPIREKKKPTFLAMRRGTIEYPMMLDQRLTSFFRV